MSSFWGSLQYQEQKQREISNMNNFHIMIKPHGAICNLDCRYCYYLSKQSLYVGSDFRMNLATLENFTRQYITAQDTPELTFAWQGGEPTLMGLDFFRKAVSLQNKYAKPGMQIQNTLQTNATLLDDAWCQFFKENGFLIGVSLDGPEPYHNAYRLDKSGSNTFKSVMAGVDLLKKHTVDINILTCVHTANADHPLEVYHFLRDEVGARFLQFIPIVERKNNTGFQEGYQVTKRSVKGKQYGRFLKDIFDEWIIKDVGQVFVQIFDVVLGAWLGHSPNLCIFSPTCGNALVIEHNGDIYSCDHYVEPNYLLGIIEEGLSELVFSPQQMHFGLDKRNRLPDYCKACKVRFICNGGCPKNRIRRTPEEEEGLNFLCEGYKLFFTHTEKPMQAMVDLLQNK